MRTPTFKYIALYEKIRDAITEGSYMPGDKIPSIRDIQENEGVSKNTVLQALNELELEGYISAHPRSGYFVEKTAPLYPLKKGTDNNMVRKFTNALAYDLDLSANAIYLDGFPFDDIQKIFRTILNEKNTRLLHQQDPKGLPSLRSSLARYLGRHRGISVHPDAIIVTAGMEYAYESLFHILPKDSVFGVEDPGYNTLSSMLDMNGIAKLHIPVDEDGIDTSWLHRSNVNIQVVTPAHQFPTGHIMSISRRNELLQWAAAQKNRYIIEDDYDSEFKWSGKPLPALYAADEKDTVIHLGNFSKSLASGFRVSFMVLPEALMDTYQNKLPHLICPVSTIQQEMLKELLDRQIFDRHLNRMRHRYRKIRSLAIESLSRYPLIDHISGDDIGLHFLLHLNTDTPEKTLVSALRHEGILIDGLSTFSQHRHQSPTLLFGFGALEEDTLERDIGRMMQVLHDIA